MYYLSLMITSFLQVNKMGGEIKVVKKNGSGTLMQLCLLLNTPIDVTGQHGHLNFREQTMTVRKMILHFRPTTQLMLSILNLVDWV